MGALGEVLYSHWTDGFSIILKKIYLASQTVLSEKNKLKNESSAVSQDQDGIANNPTRVGENDCQRKYYPHAKDIEVESSLYHTLIVLTEPVVTTCCDNMPPQKQLKEERFILAHSSRVLCSMVGKGWPYETEVNDHITFGQSTKKDDFVFN